jgi:hypothetical protein
MRTAANGAGALLDAPEAPGEFSGVRYRNILAWRGFLVTGGDESGVAGTYSSNEHSDIATRCRTKNRIEFIGLQQAIFI